MTEPHRPRVKYVIGLTAVVNDCRSAAPEPNGGSFAVRPKSWLRSAVGCSPSGGLQPLQR